jgi:hypothetical protein
MIERRGGQTISISAKHIWVDITLKVKLDNEYEEDLNMNKIISRMYSYEIKVWEISKTSSQQA